MLQAQFCVIPHGRDVESRKIFAKVIEKPDLAMASKHRLHRWNDDGLVVGRGYRPLCGETENVIRQIRDLLDHFKTSCLRGQGMSVRSDPLLKG